MTSLKLLQTVRDLKKNLHCFPFLFKSKNKIDTFLEIMRYCTYLKKGIHIIILIIFFFFQDTVMHRMKAKVWKLRDTREKNEAGGKHPIRFVI